MAAGLPAASTTADGFLTVVHLEFEHVQFVEHAPQVPNLAGLPETRALDASRQFLLQLAQPRGTHCARDETQNHGQVAQPKHDPHNYKGTIGSQKSHVVRPLTLFGHETYNIN